MDLETENGERNGVITLKLWPTDAAKAGLVVVSNAANAVKLSGVNRPSAVATGFVEGMDMNNDLAQSGFVNHLLGIVLKLELFVQIVDQAAKVIISATKT